MSDEFDITTPHREAQRIADRTYNPAGAVCPYCDHLHRPEDCDYVFYDNDYTEHSCDNCGKDFDIQPHTKWSWSTSESDG